MKKDTLLQGDAKEYATLDDWIRSEAIPFSLDSSGVLDAALDTLVSSLGDSLELLGFGEALHGSADILILRNRLFRRLVERHGFCAIAIESSFPRARVVNEYVTGCGPESYDAIRDTGFSHGFGSLDANGELVEWMRLYNADSSHGTKLRFYGFDSPTEMTHGDSPRSVIKVVLDYLSSIDAALGREYQERIDSLLGPDAFWENPATLTDPAKSVGLSPAASALRNSVEDLIAELLTRRPALVARSDAGRYAEALHYASMARHLLTYHATTAKESEGRISALLGIRDSMMADNLAYIASCESARGRVLAFAHNGHLKRGMMRWQFGTDTFEWWPAGAHLDMVLGPGYAVIGSAVGTSEANGIGQPEAGTLEARLAVAPGQARFIPTRRGRGLPASAIETLPARSGSMKNPTYFPLTSQSFTDFDWLAVLDSLT